MKCDYNFFVCTKHDPKIINLLIDGLFYSRPSSPISAFPTIAASGVPSEAINAGSTSQHFPFYFPSLDLNAPLTHL